MDRDAVQKAAPLDDTRSQRQNLADQTGLLRSELKKLWALDEDAPDAPPLVAFRSTNAVGAAFHSPPIPAASSGPTSPFRTEVPGAGAASSRAHDGPRTVKTLTHRPPPAAPPHVC